MEKKERYLDERPKSIEIIDEFHVATVSQLQLNEREKFRPKEDDDDHCVEA